MYEDLIKRLRRCEQFRCRECKYEQVMGCRAKLNSEAADAIEELSRDLDCMNDANIALYGALPKWIPVTERLPETRESILGKKSSKVIVAFRFDDGTQGTDTAHTLNGEWVFEDHITVVARTITHWRPLPKPPAVDTEEQP